MQKPCPKCKATIQFDKAEASRIGQIQCDSCGSVFKIARSKTKSQTNPKPKTKRKPPAQAPSPLGNQLDPLDPLVVNDPLAAGDPFANVSSPPNGKATPKPISKKRAKQAKSVQSVTEAEQKKILGMSPPLLIGLAATAGVLMLGGLGFLAYLFLPTSTSQPATAQSVTGQPASKHSTDSEPQIAQSTPSKDQIVAPKVSSNEFLIDSVDDQPYQMELSFADADSIPFSEVKRSPWRPRELTMYFLEPAETNNRPDPRRNLFAPGQGRILNRGDDFFLTLEGQIHELADRSQTKKIEPSDPKQWDPIEPVPTTLNENVRYLTRNIEGFDLYVTDQFLLSAKYEYPNRFVELFRYDILDSPDELPKSIDDVEKVGTIEFVGPQTRRKRNEIDLIGAASSKGIFYTNIHSFESQIDSLADGPGFIPYDRDTSVDWMDFDESENLLTIGGGKVTKWSVPEFLPLFEFDNEYRHVAILNHDRSWLAVSGGTFVDFINCETGNHFNRVVLGKRGEIMQMVLSPDGKNLFATLVSGKSSEIVWVDLNSGKLRTYPTSGSGRARMLFTGPEHLVVDDLVIDLRENVQIAPGIAGVQQTSLAETTNSQLWFRKRTDNREFTSYLLLEPKGRYGKFDHGNPNRELINVPQTPLQVIVDFGSDGENRMAGQACAQSLASQGFVIGSGGLTLRVKGNLKVKENQLVIERTLTDAQGRMLDKGEVSAVNARGGESLPQVLERFFESNRSLAPPTVIVLVDGKRKSALHVKPTKIKPTDFGFANGGNTNPFPSARKRNLVTSGPGFAKPKEEPSALNLRRGGPRINGIPGRKALPDSISNRGLKPGMSRPGSRGTSPDESDSGQGGFGFPPRKKENSGFFGPKNEFEPRTKRAQKK